MLPAASTPWKPATTATLPSPRTARRLESSIAWMRALVNAPSVCIRIWWPSSERAGVPIPSRVIASSAELTCSPVATSASISLGSGRADSSRPRASSRLVSPAIALTTTTTSWPAARALWTRSATARMRSGDPTLVPPYFWTMRLTADGA